MISFIKTEHGIDILDTNGTNRTIKSVVDITEASGNKLLLVPVVENNAGLWISIAVNDIDPVEGMNGEAPANTLSGVRDQLKALFPTLVVDTGVVESIASTVAEAKIIQALEQTEHTKTIDCGIF